MRLGDDDEDKVNSCSRFNFTLFKITIQKPVIPQNGVFKMGQPRTVVNGIVPMHISTTGNLVQSLMPSRDKPSLVRVLAELTQNVMDWTFSQDNSCPVPFKTPGM